MKQAKNNYVYGATAEKLSYDVYEENKVLKQKKRARSNLKQKFNTIVCLCTIFTMFMVIMLRYGAITETNYNIASKKIQVEKIVNENVLMKIDIEKRMDLNRIRQIASTKLGMHEPEKYQIVYVDVPKNDYTERNEEYIKSQGVLSKVSNSFEDISNLFF